MKKIFSVVLVLALSLSMFGQSACVTNILNGTVVDYQNMQASAWQQPGNSGNTGGSSSVPHGTYTLSLANGVLNVQTFPAKAYDNYYFFTSIKGYTVPTAKTRVAWAADVNIPNPSTTQAFEWEYELSINGTTYNGGVQLLFAGGAPVVRVFDFPNRRWIAVPGSTFDPSIFKTGFVSVSSEHIIDPVTKTETHVAVTINGQRFAVNFSEPAIIHFAGSNYLHDSFQLDTNSLATPNEVNITNMRLIIGR